MATNQCDTCLTVRDFPPEFSNIYCQNPNCGGMYRLVETADMTAIPPIEIQNDTDKPLFVRLCRLKTSGRLFVHIDARPGPHADMLVEANGYLQLDAEDIHEVDG
jgi:hypothetical protein